ncbi:ATP-binding protein [Bacillus cereus group sp. N21]|nr:ATP-binding protein [Bacillus cereus group sp. N21]
MKEMKLRVFERLFRTGQSRSSQSGGSGLGLAITKSLIEMHNGEIGVRDRSDGKQGSEFWFTLPITPEKTNNLSNFIIKEKTFIWVSFLYEKIPTQCAGTRSDCIVSLS